MKRPVTCLLIAEHLINDTAIGLKLNTVREGQRDYQVGDKLILVCPEAEWASQMMEVTEVSHTTTAKMKVKDYRHQNWRTRKEVLADMRGYYPTLKMDSPITVIWWKKIDE